MVWRTAVRSDNTLALGDDARRLGFEPGALVDVIVTRAGTLILRIDDTPALDVKFSALASKSGPKALRGQARRSA